jgi:hypothetical protein
MQSIITLVLFLSLLGLQSCTSVTKQSRSNKILDASQESAVEGTGTSSADLRIMAERMAREISGVQFPDELSKVRIALMEMQNESRFPLNPNLIKDRLLADLVEFSMGTKLSFTENPNGVHYFLTGRITALSKGSSEGVSDYLLYSFKLIDTADTVVWTRTYETKKQGKVGVVYQ